MIYSLWLSHALGVGEKYSHALLEHFGSAKKVYDATSAEYCKLSFLSKKAKDNLCDKDLKSEKEIFSECEKHNIKIITCLSKEYPDFLNQIENPPSVLYCLGFIECLNSGPNICVVGPREVSDYGKKSSFSLSARLSLAGFTVVSGTAKGSDTAAHKGVAAVKGKSVAVLAGGLLSDLSNRETELIDLVIKNGGAVISEFEPHYPPSKFTFPIRNRIMSGMSVGTVVIEATEKSGAIITANCANEQGRDVFVIPGNPSDPHYKGSNLLIRDGAKILLSAEDVFAEYLPMFSDKIDPEKAMSKKLTFTETEKTTVKIQKSPDISEKPTEVLKTPQKNLPQHLSNSAKTVYNNLNEQFFFPEDIKIENMGGGQLLAALSELEIFGFIESLPSGRYKLI